MWHVTKPRVHYLYGAGRIYEVACWARAERKFYEIHALHASPTTSEALAKIAALVAIKDKIRDKPAELRREARHSRTKPLLDQLHKWMEKTVRQLSPKSENTSAIRYSFSRRRELTNYVDNGRLEIDNNSAKRALRVVALGHKNYLFAGSITVGERAAEIYSLLGSAKFNVLDPEHYLRTVLARIPEHSINRIADLLPWNLAESLQAHISQAP